MDKAFLKKMKEYLLEQRKTLLASLADQGEDMRNLIKTVESGDEADVAADVIDRTLLTALGAQDANRLQQIDSALDRINQGTYGRCVKCGKEIPQERLEVLPYALMCVNCASAQERKNRQKDCPVKPDNDMSLQINYDVTRIYQFGVSCFFCQLNCAVKGTVYAVCCVGIRINADWNT